MKMDKSTAAMMAAMMTGLAGFTAAMMTGSESVSQQEAKVTYEVTGKVLRELSEEVAENSVRILNIERQINKIALALKAVGVPSRRVGEKAVDNFVDIIIPEVRKMKTRRKVFLPKFEALQQIAPSSGREDE